MNQNTIDKQELINQWEPYIKNLALKHQNTISSYEDLCQEGITILLKCINRYNNSIGFMEPLIYSSVRNGILNRAFSDSYPINIPSGSLAIIKNRNDYLIKKVEIENILTKDSNLNKVVKINGNDFDNQKIDISDLISHYDYMDIAKMYLLENYSFKEISQKTSINCRKISQHVKNVIEIIRKIYDDTTK